MAKRRKAWASKSWRPHGFACYTREWEAYKAAAELAGAKSVNGWIRGWLNEAVRYERANAKERGEV